MFTNITQRISGLLNIFFPRKRLIGTVIPQKTKSPYALYTYTSVKRDILSLKYGKYGETTDNFVNHLLSLNNPPRTVLIYTPSTTFVAGIKNIDHMRALVLKYEKTLSQIYHVCIDTIGISHLQIQHTLNRKNRFTHAKEKFYITDSFKKYIAHEDIRYIVCIDDVTTTGATRESIQTLFSKYNIHVQFIAIASQD